MKADAPAKIQTGHLLNTSQKLYHLGQLAWTMMIMYGELEQITKEVVMDCFKISQLFPETAKETQKKI
jgi:hypothetical protein